MKSESRIKSDTVVTNYFLSQLQICMLLFPQYIGISKATVKQEEN